MFSETAVPLILKSCLEAQFIVCLRTPLEMALSLHNQVKFKGYEAIRDFSAAWRLNDCRAKGEFTGTVNLPASADPRFMAYKDACLLGHQVRTLLDQVSRERVQFILLEDMNKCPDLVFRGICERLGIQTDINIDMGIRNAAKYNRSQWIRNVIKKLAALKRDLGIKDGLGIASYINKVNTGERKYDRPPVEIIMEMKNAFSEDVRLLEKMIERDLSHWLER